MIMLARALLGQEDRGNTYTILGGKGIERQRRNRIRIRAMAHPRNPEGAREVVPCRLLPKLKQALEVRAKAQGKTVSAYLESLVERDLKTTNNQLGQALPATAPPITTTQQVWPTRVVGPVQGQVPEPEPPLAEKMLVPTLAVITETKATDSQEEARSAWRNYLHGGGPRPTVPRPAGW
jgi:hypothetical protein